MVFTEGKNDNLRENGVAKLVFPDFQTNLNIPLYSI